MTQPPRSDDAAPTPAWADLSDEALLAESVSARRAMIAAELRLARAGTELSQRWESAELATMAALRPLGDLSGTDVDEHALRRADLAGRRALMQIAIVCGVSEYWITRRVDLARDVPQRLPELWSALQQAAGFTELTAPKPAQADAYLAHQAMAEAQPDDAARPDTAQTNTAQDNGMSSATQQAGAPMAGPETVGVGRAGNRLTNVSRAVVEMDCEKADVIRRETTPLQPATARAVCRRAIAQAPAWITARKTQVGTERLAAYAEPDTLADVVAAELSQRSLRYRSLGRGMGEMRITGLAPEIQEASAAIDRLVNALPAEGRTLGQRRSDVALMTLMRAGECPCEDESSREGEPGGARESARSGTASPGDRSDGSGAPQGDTTDGSASGDGASDDGTPDGSAAPHGASNGSAASHCASDGRASQAAKAYPHLEKPCDSPASASPLAQAAPPDSFCPRPRVQIQVLVPLSTLLGGGEPAELVGNGMIPAQLAREIVSDHGASATWRCVYTDADPPPRHSLDAVLDSAISHPTILGLGRAFTATGYRPPQVLREFLALRDRTCRAPGCSRPAIQAHFDDCPSLDVDHAQPHHRGGATCDCNLTPLCRHHHQLKQSRRGIPLTPLPKPSLDAPVSNVHGPGNQNPPSTRGPDTPPF